ncbi:MAG TPA: hypothetical protein VN893_00720, partial [Bryobacteraceae bacterium]|nr:hypothetical protein [Bryobacteraceae bacterium]
MKAVQVGILIALLVCAVLLFKIYSARQAAPAAVQVASAAATPVAAATPEATPAAPPSEVASAPVVDSAPARRKPAPSRGERPRHEQVAENLEPVADPMPVQMQAPAVATPV